MSSFMQHDNPDEVTQDKGPHPTSGTYKEAPDKLEFNTQREASSTHSPMCRLWGLKVQSISLTRGSGEGKWSVCLLKYNTSIRELSYSSIDSTAQLFVNTELKTKLSATSTLLKSEVKSDVCPLLEARQSIQRLQYDTVERLESRDVWQFSVVLDIQGKTLEEWQSIFGSYYDTVIDTTWLCWTREIS